VLDLEPSALQIVLLPAILAAGCAGPETGLIGELRGRTHVLRDVEDARFEEDLARDGIAIDPGTGEGTMRSRTLPRASPEAGPEVAAFPFLYSEERDGARFLEVLWPLFETGRAPLPGGGVSNYSGFLTILSVEDLRGRSRAVLFPFYYRLREEREAGGRQIDHFWPFYGLHREWIDLAPATTHHILHPLIYFRHGPERWKLFVFPLFFASRGYYDRGIWLLPLVKAGSQGPNRFFYLIEPLFSYERLSIAPSAEEDAPEKGRTRWSILGGLIGWENERGEKSLRLFWLLRI
jgi:hypothetical protein